MKYLLDTCAISERVVKQPNVKVIRFLNNISTSDAFLSIISVGELRKGIEKLPQSKKKKALHDWLLNDLLLRFDGNILDLTLDIMLFWGELTGKMEHKGKPISPMDSLIAAQALYGGFTLVTRNVKDYEHSGVNIINPWQ